MVAFFAQLSAIFDEWYAADISQRWKSDIAYRKSQGKTVGLPPFGTKRDKETGYLVPSDEGAWLLQDGTWIPGIVGESAPSNDAVWRGYYDLAKLILEMYASGNIGRTGIAVKLQNGGWAWRSRDGQLVHIETDDIRRVTSNWHEYGGLVLDKRAKDRHPSDVDPSTTHLNPERAVFDVELLLNVGRVLIERTITKFERERPTNIPYPLSNLLWCFHCEQLAEQRNLPKLQSRLSGKSEKRYRHRPGVKCGCKIKSVPRNIIEADFIDVVKMLAVNVDSLEQVKNLAIRVGLNTDEVELMRQQEDAIALCYRRLDAARNLYSDGDITRDEYLHRKMEIERELSQWEAMNIDVEKNLAQLAMAADVVNKLSESWDYSCDEDRQGLAKLLFERIVVDLDKQRIVDFRLKPWAEEFFTLKTVIIETENKGHVLPPTGLRGSFVQTFENQRFFS